MQMVTSTKKAIDILTEIRDNSEELLVKTEDSEACAMLAIVKINEDKEGYGKYVLGLMTRAQEAIDELRQPSDASAV